MEVDFSSDGFREKSKNRIGKAETQLTTRTAKEKYGLTNYSLLQFKYKLLTSRYLIPRGHQQILTDGVKGINTYFCLVLLSIRQIIFPKQVINSRLCKIFR